MAKRVVVAIGGNSLIKDKEHSTVADQHEAAAETDDHIARLVQEGWEVCITHGNGPQVGFILRRSELASSELHEVPLWVCGADTQGAIGFSLQQNLLNDFREIGIDKTAVTVVTQVEVAADDPAFANPSKRAGTWSRTPAGDGAGWWPRRSRSGSSSWMPSGCCSTAGWW
jgi:carbamate kinase